MNPSGTGTARSSGLASPRGRRVRDVFGVLFSFLLLGPPLGAVIFAFGLAVMVAGSTSNPTDVGSVFLFALLYGVPVSYWMGFPSALAAGVLTAGWRWWRGSLGVAGASLIGAVVGCVTVLAGGAQQQPGIAITLFTACLVSTLVCSRLSQAGRRSPAARRQQT